MASAGLATRNTSTSHVRGGAAGGSAAKSAAPIVAVATHGDQAPPA
jgi:hypothetical protein